MVISKGKASEFVNGTIKDNLIVNVGDKIEIINMKDEPNYAGRIGVVVKIDDIGQLHGTWGSLAIIPEEDSYIIIKE